MLYKFDGFGIDLVESELELELDPELELNFSFIQVLFCIVQIYNIPTKMTNNKNMIKLIFFSIF
jgi:hypothetical protein